MSSSCDIMFPFYLCSELGASGTKSLLAVPISFVSEHIETLEEIDMEYR